MKSRIIGTSAVFIAFLIGFLSFHPIAQAVESFGIVKCSSATAACAGGSNTLGGPGVMGTSAQGNGVVANTSFNSTSAKQYRSGVIGQDRSTAGKWDAGVTGTSARGTGVLGTSSSYIGVNGISTTNTGVWGQVNGGTKLPTGVVGVDASRSVNGAGVAGQSNAGSGLVGTTLGSANSSQSVLAFAPNGGYIFVGVASGSTAVASIDGNGNLVIAGQIYTAGQCGGGCMRSHRVQSYGASATLPTLEDTGEAQLVGGAAYVRLDAAFANAIDQRQGYFVLITPEGETHGLFVAQRSPSGFAVRENLGGRSNATFAYRIVAHPYGVHERRLPFVDLHRAPTAALLPQAAHE